MFSKTCTEKDEQTKNLDKKQINILDEIENIFVTPIQTNKSVKELDETVIKDLELVESNDKESTPIYHRLTDESSKATNKVFNLLAKNYTTDTLFLSETQTLIKRSKPILKLDRDNTLDQIISVHQEILNETGFCEKYLYIDWSFGKFLNKNPQFLQFMSLYNILSPILSLLLPIFILIIPFFIIQIKGLKITFSEYITVLKSLIADHAITKVFTEFHKVDSGQRFYLVISAAFYVFSIYQNILVCIRFYTNMAKIHNYLNIFRNYIADTTSRIEVIKHDIKQAKLVSYEGWQENEIIPRWRILTKYFEELDKTFPLKFSMSNVSKIGHIMQCFYQLYDNDELRDALIWSYGFNGYMDINIGMCKLVNNDKLGKATFKDEKKEEKEDKEEKRKKSKKSVPTFKNMYYPNYINSDKENVVKNDLVLKKNFIITGPNASGKTTTIKAAFINLLMAQQFGYGCYDSLSFKPFDHFHCYMNIPDTSGRDSLFQAEARRCKDIVSSVKENGPNETHFCIFDELYSGTNPEEAVLSAYAFLKFLASKTNASFILTTHYIDLCNKMETNKHVENWKMDTETQQPGTQGTKEGSLKYTYKLTKGISTVKGGLAVLKEMDYPTDILDGIDVAEK
jgi:hypothetical protein